MGTQLPPSPKRRGTADRGFLTHAWMYLMPLGTEVGLGPRDIVLDGDSAPKKRGTTVRLTFRPMSFVAKRLGGAKNACLKCAARGSLKYRTQKIAICAPLHNFVGLLCLRK